MKKMICKIIKALLFCMMVTVFFSGNTASAKKIAINKKNFSEDMISYVVRGHDEDEDGYLSDKELKSIDSIELSTCDERWPFDFNGIEKLAYLKEINCSGIKFNDFKYEILKKIKVLQLYGCKLDYLQFEKMPLLEELSIDNLDARTTYNFRNNKKLRKLSIINCKINRLDISSLKNLEELRIHSGIPKCDISKNKKLKVFELTSEKWDKLDLSKNKALKEVIIKNNKIKTVDIRSQKKIESLEVKAKKCTKILMPYAKKLETLHINAPIKSFDSSKVPNIESLMIMASIPELALDNNSKLKYLYVDAPVDTLDIGKVPDLEYLALANNYIGVFNSAHPKLSELIIKKCDVAEINVSGLPQLRSVIVSNSNLNNFIASENNALLDEIDFRKCKELMSVEIKKLNRMNVVTYDYVGHKSSNIDKKIDEVWDSHTGQIELMEKLKDLNIYYSPAYDDY